MAAQPCPAPLQTLLVSVPKCGDRGEGAPGRGSPKGGSPARPLTSDLWPPPGAPVRVLSQEPLAAGRAHPRGPRRGRLRLHAAGRRARPHRGCRSRGPGRGKGPRPGADCGKGEDGTGQRWRGARGTLPASLQAAGLKEGDYIVSVNGQPCRWWKHADVVAQLKGVGDEGVSLQVLTLLPGAEPPGSVSPGALGGWSLTPCPAPALGLPPSPQHPQMPGGHSGDLPGSSRLCCGLHLVAAPALDKAPAHPSAGLHPPGGPGVPCCMAALPGTPPCAP